MSCCPFLSLKTPVVDDKMIIKVQYQSRKKYIKLQAADFEEFVSEGKFLISNRLTNNSDWMEAIVYYLTNN